jgi:hypothetical protein
MARIYRNILHFLQKVTQYTNISSLAGVFDFGYNEDSSGVFRNSDFRTHDVPPEGPAFMAQLKLIFK